MQSKFLKFALAAAVMTAGMATHSAFADAKKEFNIAWSIYVGWMPWPYAADAGIVKNGLDKYGITINITQINDYVESLNQYTAGKFDGVTVASMDALTIPRRRWRRHQCHRDYSNGNDGIVLKDGKTLADIKGRDINIVEFSVSHYLLARGLDTVGLTEKDVKTVNTSDVDIVAAFKSPDSKAVVTWNPQLQEVKAEPTATEVFDSSKIPGEIEDLLVVNTETLKDNPDLGKALVGAWYETLALVKADTPEGKAAREAMGKLSGTDLAGFESQLKTTFLFDKPADAVKFTTSPDLVKIQDLVRKFSFDHALLGTGATSPDVVGIEMPAGTLGDPKNIKLRFDPMYMQMAADGKL